LYIPLATPPASANRKTCDARAILPPPCTKRSINPSAVPLHRKVSFLANQQNSCPSASCAFIGLSFRNSASPSAPSSPPNKIPATRSPTAPSAHRAMRQHLPRIHLSPTRSLSGVNTHPFFSFQPQPRPNRFFMPRVDRNPQRKISHQQKHAVTHPR